MAGESNMIEAFGTMTGCGFFASYARSTVLDTHATERLTETKRLKEWASLSERNPGGHLLRGVQRTAISSSGYVCRRGSACPRNLYPR